MKSFPPGKLPVEILESLLGRLSPFGPEVLLPPRVGTDATVIAFGERCLVAASDPITFATDEAGWYSVMVNANDVVCLGAEPRWFLATVLLPEHGAERGLVERIFNDITDACREVGATLCGGHTEITYGLDRPIISATMLGDCARDRLVTPAGMRPGDVVLATKGIAIEGTAVLAREASGGLNETSRRLNECVDAAMLERMRRLLHDPGISVVPDARVACSVAMVHAMHDVTEGGIATALRELAAAGNCGIEVDVDAIALLPETQALCDAMGADPLGMLGSGCLLIAVAEEEAEGVLRALAEAGISVSAIGRVLGRGEGVWVIGHDGERQDLPLFARDEVARLLQ